MLRSHFLHGKVMRYKCLSFCLAMKQLDESFHWFPGNILELQAKTKFLTSQESTNNDLQKSENHFSLFFFVFFVFFFQCSEIMNYFSNIINVVQNVTLNKAWSKFVPLIKQSSASRVGIIGWNPNCRRTFLVLSTAVVSQLQFRNTGHCIFLINTMIIEKPLEHMATNMDRGQVGKFIFTIANRWDSMAPEYSRCTNMTW